MGWVIDGGLGVGWGLRMVLKVMLVMSFKRWCRWGVVWWMDVEMRLGCGCCEAVGIVDGLKD